MKNIKFTFKDFSNEIVKDILKAERKSRAKAASFLSNKVKEALDNPEDENPSLAGEAPNKKTGRLFKSPAWAHDKENSISLDGGTTKVGFAPKGYHAHLMENGTKMRRTKKGYNRGKVSRRPFFFPTLERYSKEAIKIMSEKYGL